MTAALVLFSGGQDSTTCLFWAIKQFGRPVYAIGFDYGQQHRVELGCAAYITDNLSVPFRVIDLRFYSKIVSSALIGNPDGSIRDTRGEHSFLRGRPASFVPNRNALMLTIAHAFAQEIGAEVIVTGANQTDYSGYPDCRRPFLEQLFGALNAGSEQSIQFEAPLLDLSKAQTFALAEQLGCLDVVVRDSHTCYEGNREDLHPWGYGCGTCPACVLRARGWGEFVNTRAPMQGDIL